jgi:hypothetical protein
MQTEILMGGLAAMGTLTVVQGALLWRATRALSRMTALDGRIDKFGDAINLLTDTTESAFRAVAAEMSRRPAASPAKSAAVSATRTRRVARAVRRGDSVTQIAAAEEIAEGEVRLRLHVANDDKGTPARAARPRTRKTSGGASAAVRLD